jgi:hypothetical protein
MTLLLEPAGGRGVGAALFNQSIARDLSDQEPIQTNVEIR